MADIDLAQRFREFAKLLADGRERAILAMFPSMLSVIESRETSINSQQDPQEVDRLDKPSILDDVWIYLRRQVSH